MARDITKTNLKLDPHQVVLRPLVTEKGYHKAEQLKEYTFEVSPFASKEDIRNAVETLFDVRVLRVNTQNRKGKPRRTRFKRSHTKNWKKAIVKLHEESRSIDFF